MVPRYTWQMWRLVPVEVNSVFTPARSLPETLGPGSPPPYEGDAGESYTHAQHTGLERNELGTVVNEVTVVTTTVTTRKRYRVENV